MPDEFKIFSPVDGERIAETVFWFEHTLNASRPPARLPVSSSPEGYWVKNESSDAVPPYGVMVVTGSSNDYEDSFGDVILLVNKPSTTFYPEVLYNGELEIPAGEVAFVYIKHKHRIAHDPDWTPIRGETSGPKPGSWFLFKGYPSTTLVDGQVDADNSILLGTLSPITSLLCKAVGARSVGTITTGQYKIWSGGVVGGADSGFTTLPDIYIQADLSDGDFFLAHWTNGKWVSPKGGGKGKTWHATAPADIAAGSSGNVLLPDTSIGSSGVVSATNWSDDVDIDNGDKIEVYQDPFNDLYYCFKPGSTPETVSITIPTAFRYDATTHQIQIKTRLVKVLEPEDESDWTMVHQLVADTFATDLEYSEHTLAWNTRDAYVFELGDETAGDSIVFTLKTFVASVYMDGIDEKQYQFDGYCVDPTSETSSGVVDGINCSLDP